jgi:Zn-finger nucleic acid-binding protein
VSIDRARCAKCWTLVTVGARACERCGSVLPASAQGDPTDAPCPRCKAPLSRLEADAELAGTDALHECRACGGVFVGHAALLEVARLWRRGEVLPPALTDAAAPADDVVQYLACPACGRRMNRRRLGRVVVDVCSMHGTWMDRGEASRVIEKVDVDKGDAARRTSSPEVVAAEVRMRMEALRETREVGEQVSLVRQLLHALFGLPPV